MASQGPGDEDLAAVTTEEPLTAAGADALGSTPPEGPPLPLPSVAPERGTPPVSEDFTSHRVVKICLGQSYRGGKESCGEGLAFHLGLQHAELGLLREHRRRLQFVEIKQEVKTQGPWLCVPGCPHL